MNGRSTGRVDGAGRLVAADSALAALNARAGGAIGAALAVPQLAVLAQLTRRLGVAISRQVVAADGPDEVELWVRAALDGDDVSFDIGGWRLRPAWIPPVDEMQREHDLLVADADWSWETDTALRLTMIGEAAMDDTARSALLGQSIDALLVPDRDEHGAMPLLASLLSHGGFDDQPATLRSGGGRVLLSARPRLDGAGMFAGYVGAARRVASPVATARTGHDDALTGSLGEQLDRALRAPLDRIVANADSIHAQTEGPIRQDYADYAADIASAGRHLMGLVDDIVDLQAVERDDYMPSAEAIDLADVGRRAAGLLSVRAGERGVRIDAPQEIDAAPATGEFRRTLQILVNLIGNAVRYSPDGGMVWVRTHRDRNTAVIIVADQGKGIAPEDQSRVFEKFERVDPTEPGGSGLGLYIARRLARAMGGDLTVDSAQGQGARFMLSLPTRAARQGSRQLSA